MPCTATSQAGVCCQSQISGSGLKTTGQGGRHEHGMWYGYSTECGGYSGKDNSKHRSNWRAAKALPVSVVQARFGPQGAAQRTALGGGGCTWKAIAHAIQHTNWNSTSSTTKACRGSAWRRQGGGPPTGLRGPPGRADHSYQRQHRSGACARCCGTIGRERTGSSLDHVFLVYLRCEAAENTCSFKRHSCPIWLRAESKSICGGPPSAAAGGTPHRTRAAAGCAQQPVRIKQASEPRRCGFVRQVGDAGARQAGDRAVRRRTPSGDQSDGKCAATRSAARFETVGVPGQARRGHKAHSWGQAFPFPHAMREYGGWQ